MIVCPECKNENVDTAKFCSGCGFNLGKNRRRRKETGDATGGMIPYKNPKALVSYYLGIFSILPFIGIPLGITAFILGILGLKDRKKNPVIKGSVHAWIGIIGGFIFSVLWTGLIIISIVAKSLK